MRAMLVFIWGNYKPHLVMVITKFCLAVSSILLQSVLSTGISALVVVVYEHMISACVLSALAFFFEKGTRPPFSFQILCYSFFLGFLLITVFQTLRTLSLQYVEATYSSVALNLMAAIVFVLALIFGQEDLQFCTIRGQAKMWGVGVSAAGALIMVLWAGPTLFDSAFTASKSSSIIGGSMLVVSMLAGALWNLLVGIMVTGLSYYAHVWCVHKKGPVFAAAFQPLLIVFTFLLEATVLREATHLGSLIGAVLVILGLYMLLWGKAKDTERQGMSGLVLVVYEHTIATCVLIPLAFFLEKGKRPPLSSQTLCYTFLLALLLISICQIMLTLSLQYVAATYESIALNVMPMMVFVLAVLFGLEELQFGTVHGQAKMWGVVFSVAGALTMVLWTGPTLFKYTLATTKASIIGGTMLAMAALGGASFILLVGQVTRNYPAELSLSAMISFFGTIQTAVITGFLVTGPSWKLKWDGGLMLITLLLGGILMTGLFYYAQVWCVHQKGPVFTAAFQPLLIVFSFLLEATVLKESTHLGSIIGAVLVVLGLYMLLWGKAKDQEQEGKGMQETDGSINSPLII